MFRSSWSRRCQKSDHFIGGLRLGRPSGFPVRSLAAESPAPRQIKPRWKSRYWLYGAAVASGFATLVLYLWYTGDEAKGALNPHDFTSYRLVSREPVSSTSSLFVLRPRSIEGASEIYGKAWQKGVWSVQVKQPQLQIARSYTPFPLLEKSEESNPYDLRFLIRRDPAGEVSGYLHKLAINADVELRGPRMEYEIPDNVKQLVFLAGGTGIAPALQMAHTLLDRTSPSDPLRPQIHILWANRRAEDAIDRPLKPQRAGSSWNSCFGLASDQSGQPMSAKDLACSGFAAAIKSLKSKYQDRLQIDYYVDEEKTFITEGALKKCLEIGNAGDTSISESAHSDRRLLIISGPEGFVNHFAGPKVWRGGEEGQGPLGGLVRKLNTSGWEIWKL